MECDKYGLAQKMLRLAARIVQSRTKTLHNILLYPYLKLELIVNRKIENQSQDKGGIGPKIVYKKLSHYVAIPGWSSSQVTPSWEMQV